MVPAVILSMLPPVLFLYPQVADVVHPDALSQIETGVPVGGGGGLTVIM